MPYLLRNGLKTFYEVVGEGPPMLMLHANTTDHNLFLYQVARFSTWFRVITPDLRGWGRSEGMTKPFSLMDVAADIAAVCKAENASGIVAMGVSIGTKVALQLALEWPGLVRAVIAVSGAVRPAARGGENAKRYRDLGVEKIIDDHVTRTMSESFAQSCLGTYLRNTVVERAGSLGWRGDAVAEIMEAAGKDDIRPGLSRLQIPTLVINGEHDHSRPRGEEMVRLIPGARHAILPGTGHCCNIEDPAGFDALVLEFLIEKRLLPDPMKELSVPQLE